MFNSGKIGCAIFLAVFGVQSGLAQGNPATQQALPVENSQLIPALSGHLNLTNRMNQSEPDRVTPDFTNQQQLSPYGLACDVTLSATKTAGAMVQLDLIAPCHMDRLVTIHHAGLAFTALTSSVGQLGISVPAMTDQAVFDVNFPDGKTVSATVDVPEVNGFERVAVQWTGESGLRIHAFEMGGSRHVRATTPQSVARALQARGGYLTVLGPANSPTAKHAEVYSFPTGQMNKSGVVRLSVKAEVTVDTCGKEIEAQVLQSGISVVDVTVSMPGCDAIGDFLVLNNLLRDVKIARNKN